MSNPQTAITTIGEAALAQLNEKLEGLKQRAEQLVVENAADIITAKNLKLDINAYIKAVEFQTGPEIEIAKERLRRLKEQQAMLMKPAEDILETSEAKRKAWENEERRLALIEQNRRQKELDDQAAERAEAERQEAERIAAERKKTRVAEIRADLKAGKIGKRAAAKLLAEAGAQEEADKCTAAAQVEETKKAVPRVEVRPDIPAVAGTVSRQNWKWKWKDGGEDMLVEAFHKDYSKRPYVCGYEKGIGETVRAIKDRAKAEALIPGIEVWAD